MTTESPDYMTLAGIITGIIGALTGIISLVEVRKLKSRDLRMDRGRLQNTLEVSFGDLKSLLEKANKSRISQYAARGLSKSGSMEKWQLTYKQIITDIDNLSIQFAALKRDSSYSKNLDAEILALHLIDERVKSLIGELNTSIAEDDKARAKISMPLIGQVPSKSS
jgi:hypothetical protein